jgi:hypothetical protein
MQELDALSKRWLSSIVSIDIKQDRAGDVEAAGGRRLRQRHRIALDRAGLLRDCEHRLRERMMSLASWPGARHKRAYESVGTGLAQSPETCGGNCHDLEKPWRFNGALKTSTYRV